MSELSFIRYILNIRLSRMSRKKSVRPDEKSAMDWFDIVLKVRFCPALL
jgi:hypothetical protein